MMPRGCAFCGHSRIRVVVGIRTTQCILFTPKINVLRIAMYPVIFLLIYLFFVNKKSLNQFVGLLYLIIATGALWMHCSMPLIVAQDTGGDLHFPIFINKNIVNPFSTVMVFATVIKYLSTYMFRQSLQAFTICSSGGYTKYDLWRKGNYVDMRASYV